MPESAKPDSELSFQSGRDTKKIFFDENDHSKFVTVGANLDPKEESKLVEFLCDNRNIFVWSPKDMPGVPGNSPSTLYMSGQTQSWSNNPCAASQKKGGR